MGKRGRKAIGKARRIGMIGLAGGVLLSGSLQVNAATLKDIFDEHYYADTYRDLKEIFGYDREALWNHFVTYGLGEGRNMNGLIDVAKYREEYADLDAAFGDNWDAYLNHYLTYGAKEGRDTGTDFNALDYAGRYEDLQEAFGEDVLSLWKHYQAFGATENREARDEQIVTAEKKAAKAAEEARKEQENQKPEEPSAPGESEKPEEPSAPGESEKPEEPSTPQEPSESQARTERIDNLLDNGWGIYEYDDAGKLVKVERYGEDGTRLALSIYEYNTAGNVEKEIFYNQFGEMGGWAIYEYDSAGRMIIKTNYRASDGTISGWEIREYNSAGIMIKHGFYYENGKPSQLIEYDDNGKYISSTSYDSDGNIIIYESDEDGTIIKKIAYHPELSDQICYIDFYNSTGTAIIMRGVYLYEKDGSYTVTYYDSLTAMKISSEKYNSMGKRISETDYREDGTVEYVYDCDDTGFKFTKITRYREDGTKEYVKELDEEGNVIKISYYDEEGNEIVE